MPGDTSIEWTDRSWNPTVGCTRVSPGCDNCYAFKLHDQRHAAWKAGRMPNAPAQYHKPFSEVQLLPDRLTVPLRWREPKKIFVDSMADLFHPAVPDDFIVRVWAVMAMAPQHTFQILTKRPQRMQRFVSERLTVQGIMNACWSVGLSPGDPIPPAELKRRLIVPRLPLPNVWLGTSVESQEAAFRIDYLVQSPAAVRFLSVEPMLGPLDLSAWFWEEAGPEWAGMNPSPNLGWIICGGESGPRYRPLNVAWARDLRDQCIAAQAPFFFKQHGGRTPKAGGRILDGRTWDEMPAVAS